MIDPEDIIALLSARRRARGPLMEQMRSMSKHYNNDIIVPLPELGEGEEPAVANFIAQGIDQHGMRIASTMPSIDSPVIRKGQEAYDRAKKRRMAAYGWMERNAYDLLLRRRSRHLVAYAATWMVLSPDPTTRSTAFDVRSPLDAYPADAKNAVDFHPDDAIFTYTRTWGWLNANYPAAAAAVRQKQQVVNGARDGILARDDKVEMAVYYDCNETVTIAYAVVGQAMTTSGTPYLRDTGDFWNHTSRSASMQPRQWAVEVDRAVNLAGCCPVIGASRMSLDTPKGQFDDMTGLFAMQAKLMALDVNATFRAVYPESWLVIDPSLGGEVVRPADGLKGQVGIVRGGSLQQVNMQPGFNTGPAMDRLERAMRINGSLPAEFSGESPTNVRTDRRGNTVQAAMTDFHIDECQKLLGRSIKHELAVAAEIEQAYYGNEKKSFYVSWGSKPGYADYVPNDVFDESTEYTVRYPFSGLDNGQVIVEVGQAIGEGTLSVRSGMELISFVDDVDQELRRMDEEALHNASKAALLQGAATGAVAVADVIRMEELMLHERMDFFEAWNQAQAEAQTRQASNGQPGTPAGPVPPGSPEAQPGVGPPGQGVEQPTTPAVQGSPIQAPQSLMDLRSLFNSLGARNPVTHAGNAGGA